MNADLIEIARLTNEEVEAAVRLLREGEPLTLESICEIASTMAAGPAQLGMALIELKALAS